MTEARCLHCGSPFHPVRKNHRFCQRKCAVDYHNARRSLEADLLYNARARAKAKGIPFNLTIDDIVVPDLCPILGIKLVRGVGRANHIESSPSLDRLCPDLGYVRGNVAVMSMRANRIKNDASIEELRSVVAFMERAENVRGQNAKN